MATMKMCKQSNGSCCGCETSQTMVMHGACGAPEKKHHFWHRNKNNEQASHKHQGHGIRQCYGLGGNKPTVVGHDEFVHHEDEDFLVMHTRIETKEEHVRIVHVKNKARIKGKCGDGWQLGFLKD